MTFHERECTKDYKIPNTDFIVPKGRVVHVYFKNIINDEKNFVEPDHFYPENFSAENHTNKFSFLSFGQGPRACPGEEFDSNYFLNGLKKHLLATRDFPTLYC